MSYFYILYSLFHQFLSFTIFLHFSCIYFLPPPFLTILWKISISFLLFSVRIFLFFLWIFFHVFMWPFPSFSPKTFSFYFLITHYTNIFFLILFSFLKSQYKNFLGKFLRIFLFTLFLFLNFYFYILQTLICKYIYFPILNLLTKFVFFIMFPILPFYFILLFSLFYFFIIFSFYFIFLIHFIIFIF